MYEVFVGNLGRVYHGDSKEEAESVFATYKKHSEQGGNYGIGEYVTLFENDVIMRECYGMDCYASDYLNEMTRDMNLATDAYWTALRKKRPQEEIDRLEAEVTRLSRLIRGAK